MTSHDWFIMGCSADCEEGHTYVWGRCALGAEWTTEKITVDLDDTRNDD